MANDEHVAMLKKGVDAWNAWRDENPSIVPDLHGADLSGADLSGADLSRADLSGADLSRVDLSEAKLHGVLSEMAKLYGADLSGADLSGADLTGADLGKANLSEAAPRGGPHRGGPHRGEPDPSRHNGCKLGGGISGRHGFADITLSEANRLDDCHHLGPSIIDFQTLRNSGLFPRLLKFLRGIGLPDTLIDNLPSLLNEANQHYSCFISYSSKDQAFAERLQVDLQNKGVRCWFAPHDMRIGAKIIDAIDEAIRLQDKVLLILSEGAIASGWVEGEVTRALDEERKRKEIVLFPVRIDDVVMQTSEGWARLLRGQRNIGDFTRWKEHDSYQKSFERLMRDLRVETSRR
jgi:uncharacterized protein YjbI with pentapeptide repeats